jgi:hypothetical protein
MVMGAAMGAAVQPGTAWADDLHQITITGDDLAEPLVILAADSPRRAAALYEEVSWLTGRSGNADEPDEEILGPAYVIEVHIDGEARHRYVLYPLADGGPRAYRPAEQPGDRKAREAWFYGRLSMPDTLGAAGVPLPGAPPRMSGGGTGGGDEPAGETSPPGEAVGLVDTWREGMQLTALVGITIAAGLAAVALLIRRRV